MPVSSQLFTFAPGAASASSTAGTAPKYAALHSAAAALAVAASRVTRDVGDDGGDGRSIGPPLACACPGDEPAAVGDPVPPRLVLLW